ncbi:hypothetical protein SCLCIDRAFT_991904 [Scleroderma citrinum Foug A]|uniref:Uncharacterized protein n=1 Tax=Scleroderma citrinum Foug A TaxID=1036808 RepID=A0A0C3A4Q5_9AGAM|nr:hypothetical protein SCLCIDRAFT_991904 [Scleroderma citrinum Foug A]
MLPARHSRRTCCIPQSNIATLRTCQRKCRLRSLVHICSFCQSLSLVVLFVRHRSVKDRQLLTVDVSEIHGGRGQGVSCTGEYGRPKTPWKAIVPGWAFASSPRTTGILVFHSPRLNSSCSAGCSPWYSAGVCERA